MILGHHQVLRFSATKRDGWAAQSHRSLTFLHNYKRVYTLSGSPWYPQAFEVSAERHPGEAQDRVTVTDLEGISQTAQVTATTLYEAVALGLAAVRGHEWVAGIPHGLATVRVSVTSVAVEHAVKVRDFTRWLERKGGSPREVTDRDRIRAILGLPHASG